MWRGIGINYGHQNVYDPTIAENDFSFLQSAGVTRLRVAMGAYNSTTRTANGQDMVQRALAHGFYVVWGFSTGVGKPNLTATIWATYKDAVINQLAPWAQANGLSELSLGNECDYQVDGTTLTAAQVRADIRTIAMKIKANGYTGKVSYSTTIITSYYDAWVNEGIGNLDIIGWNSYDILKNFQNRNPLIVSNFGNSGYVSEFGCIQHGYPDYNDETLWYNDVVARITSMQNAGIQAGYFFCYRDGGYGLTPNTYGLVETNGNVRLARNVVLGT